MLLEKAVKCFLFFCGGKNKFILLLPLHSVKEDPPVKPIRFLKPYRFWSLLPLHSVRDRNGNPFLSAPAKKIEVDSPTLAASAWVTPNLFLLLAIALIHQQI